MALKPISEIADQLGIDPAHVLPYGTDKAKIRPEARDSGRPPGKLILVSAITPTKAGEGKTTTSIGLVQGLAHIGESVAAALREPSLGPTFGRKGGATGGGKATVEPAADINLHFTGDFHAVTSAHNLLAAMLDNHIHFGNALDIDPRRVVWRRVVDLNDRSLRQVIIGLGGVLEGIPRETGFDITPASEIMAILCLAEDEDDLRARLSRIVVGLTHDREAVTAQDLKAVGAMMVLLRDAMMPNLVQTVEGVPCFIHGGPFANIAHGCNSVMATKMAMAYADWTVTEAGFGFDLGAEKFFDIKCTKAGLDTAAVVLVATVRALKLHGGADAKNLEAPDAGAVERGIPNLEKHIDSIHKFTEVPVVGLNKFGTDTDEEIEVVRKACERLGVPFAVNDGFANGGVGAADLARAVVEHAEHESSPFHRLYACEDPFKTKLEKVAKFMYGAASVNYTAMAERNLRQIQRLGMGDLPICVAKTPDSLSDDPKLVGRPEGFEVTVRGIIAAPGAGYLVPLLGDVMRMPGLPREPQAFHMDLKDGEIIGVQ